MASLNVGVERGEMTDRMLISGAIEGEEDAFQTLYRKYYLRIYRMILPRSTSRDEAEDLLQVTFMRAFRGLGAYRGEAAFSTWLTRIALNVCCSHLQSRKAERGRVEKIAADQVGEWGHQSVLSEGNPEEVMYRKECQDLVMQGIRALPGHYRKAMWLRYVKDRSYAEIERELKVPMATVKTWICRGKRQLKTEFRKQGVSGT
jgi:RNA polymerase sigma-70 factor (ECF subfamily)